MMCCWGETNDKHPVHPCTSQQDCQSKTPDENLDLVRVSVPTGTLPGQRILVQHPMNEDRVVSVIIPEGHYPGSNFNVSFGSKSAGVSANYSKISGVQSPPSSSDGGISGLGVSKSPSTSNSSRPKEKQGQNKYKRCSEEMLLLHNKGLVKIKVPPKLNPGDMMRVQIPDGRMINIVVPPGNMSHFHVKVPNKKQNLHDNPIAVYAPMALGPLLM